jgi:two-component system sensor histidine kinase CreC
MKLSLRMVLGFFVIVALAAYLLLSTFLQEVKPGVKQGLEVALVDSANLLAEVAAPELAGGTLAEGRFARAVAAYQARAPHARIFGVEKPSTEFRVYVTDAQGLLVWDSAGTPPGADFSRWNDVYLTLRGGYGARASLADPGDPGSHTMYVGAPVRWEGKLIGVLTVASPTATLTPFAERSQRRVLNAGLVLLGACLLIGGTLTWGLVQAIRRMRVYAREVAEGHRVQIPEVGGGELSELAGALESMRARLEDRAYVERYVATLTHEMKSPLAAIRGAAELLEEDMPEADRHRFVGNIRAQEQRLRELLDRMLDQAALEQRTGLQEPADLDLEALVRRVAEAKEVALARRNLRLVLQLTPGLRVHGEAFLLEQALSNLLDNALAFAPEGSPVSVTSGRTPAGVRLAVRDAGPGLPDYAVGRVFEAFYSLPSPATGRKGTGLGLRFVKEVAELHGGTAGLQNLPEGGAEAWLQLPG